jgi:uncharacterized protein YdeI (YjbR/CyaY-like superfamily)
VARRTPRQGSRNLDQDTQVDSGFKSITPKEAVDVVLCWGWIDGIRKGFDDKSYLQRYTPRSKRSIWSQSAYKGGKDMKVPSDRQAAIDTEPKAKAMLAKLSAPIRAGLSHS